MFMILCSISVTGSHNGSLDCPSSFSIAFIYVKKVYRVSWGYRGFLFQVAETDLKAPSLRPVRLCYVLLSLSDELF